MRGLTNREQAIVMLLVFILPSLITWAGLGFPTDRAALGVLFAAILSGVLAFLKEILGGTAPPPPEEEPHE